jgi:hypothetical protein
MVGLCLVILHESFLLVLGLFFTAAALAFPKLPAIWALAILLAIEALGPFHGAPDWRFFVVLAGAHALHLFGLMLNWLPLTGRIQLRVLGRMLRSYLIIQVPAQLIAFVVLTLLSGNPVAAALTSPLFGLLAGVGLVGLVAFVIVPILRRE